jgi:hypothetical protein
MNFVFSLDCELGWAEPSPPDERWEPLRSDPHNGRNIYKRLLDLFEKYNIPATWAFVGHLFLNGCTPDDHYTIDYIKKRDPYLNIENAPLYYGDDLIEMVDDNKINHEIAGHSFAHEKYTNMSEEEAREDIFALSNAAKSNGYNLKSFVFPSNQVNHSHILEEFDFKIFRRGNLFAGPYTYKEGITTFIKRPNHFLSVLPAESKINRYNVVEQYGSLSLRSERWWFLQPYRIKRCINSMDENQTIHVSSHPHNFIQNKYLLRVLDSVLSTISGLKEQNKIDVMTMSEFANEKSGSGI